jgi:hypothetical protein
LQNKDVKVLLQILTSSNLLIDYITRDYQVEKMDYTRTVLAGGTYPLEQAQAREDRKIAKERAAKKIQDRKKKNASK